MPRGTPSWRAALLAATLLTTVAPLSVAHAAPGDGLVAGVVRLDGHPVAGAIVTLTLVPGLDAPVGPYRQYPSATGVTDPTGGFSLQLQVVDQVLQQAADNSGYVNYVLEPFYNADDPGDLYAGLSGTAYSAADLGYARVKDTGAFGTAADVTEPVLTAPDPVTLEMTAVETADVGQDTATGTVTAVTSGDMSADSVGNALRDNSGQCRSMYAPYVTVEQREINYDPVGEAHVMYDMSGTFEYGEHANTDLNGAYSFKGGPWQVTWQANHVGNKGGMIRVPFGERQAYVVKTGFRYRKERLDFTDDYGDGHICRSDYRILPEGWISGDELGADVSSHDSAGQLDAAKGKQWAAKFLPGTSFEKNTAKGYKYHTGVEAFGVGLYAKSEWSAQVDVHWTFGKKQDIYWLYGSNNDPVKAENVYGW